jgi:threonine dehydratase
LLLKLEFLQHSGSFKARGAFNRVLAAAESGELTDAGVIAASGGNAGMAFGYAAAVVGVPAEVYVPQTAPAVKVAKLRALGATVVQHGREYVEAYEAARKRQAETGAVFCHPYDQPEVVAGQGTVALELPAVDTVLVAVGGGGLVSGIAAALEGRSRVVGVEPESCPTLHAALVAGEPVDVPVGGVAADSLGARRLGEIAFQVVTRCAVASLLVSDEVIVAARRDLWDRYRIVVEHGAATAWAALFTGGYRPQPGERVAVVLCGANTDPADLG